MNILVCVKQVSESTEPNAAKILNPADGCALEAALRLRENGRVTVLSMGRSDVESLLRDLIARGADEAILVTDPACAGADTLATARVLSACVQKFGPFDMVLTGRRAVDGETGLTGPRAACLLGWPCVTDVISLAADGVCRRDTVEGIETLIVCLPAVFALSEGSFSLRLASLTGMRRAKSAVIRQITASDLALSPELCGLTGSPTRVIDSRELATELRHTLWLKDGRDLLRVVREALALPDRAARPASDAEQRRLSGEVWVVCDRPDPALIRRAQQLSGGRTVCLIWGDNPPGCDGCQRVIRLNTGACADELAVSAELAGIIARDRPDAVLFPSTPVMRCVASGVATFLQTGLTADCTGLDADECGRLVSVRPTYGGARLARILCPDARPQMALVRRGVFDGVPDCAAPAESKSVRADIPARVRRLALEPAASQADLGGARLILSGGVGLNRDDFARLNRLANRLGGLLGASRAAVDAGFAPYACQIGQTGRTVRPKVYVAIGISGAIQHILGMSRAETVIAVNTDRKAPVFNLADYGLIADGGDIIRQIEEELS